MAAPALAARLAFLVAFRRDLEPISDAGHYQWLAQAVADGRGFALGFPLGFEHASAFRPPLYPLVLGGLYRALGDRLLAGMLLNVAIGVAVALAVAVFAARLAGPRAGLAAGTAAAFHPALIANDTTTLSEPLGLLLLVTMALALLDDRPAPAGVFAGLLVLVRASAQLLPPLLAVVALPSLGLRRSLRFLGVALLVTSPWIVRNWVELGSPTLVTSNGFNLAAVYSPEAAGRGFVDPVLSPDLALLREGHLTETGLDHAWRAHALHGVRSHPSRVARVVAANATRWLEIRFHDNDEAERLDGRPLGFRHATLPLVYLTFAGGAAGLFATRQRRETRLALVVMAYFGAASLATVASPRLRAPVDVFLCVGLGLLAARLVHRAGFVEASASDDGARRPADFGPRRLDAALAVALVIAAAAGPMLRERTEERAATELRDALARHSPDVEAVTAWFPLDPGAARPEIDLDRARGAMALQERLLDLVARLPDADRRAVEVAFPALETANRHLHPLVLLVADERSRHAEQWSMDGVRVRYESARSADPDLPPWAELLRGAAVGLGAEAVASLSRASADDAGDNAGGVATGSTSASTPASAPASAPASGRVGSSSIPRDASRSLALWRTTRT